MNEHTRFCTNCGSPVKPGTRFCGQCGQAIQAAAVPPGPPRACPPPTPVASAPVPRAPTAPAEPIVGIIAGLQQRKGLLGMSSNTFNLIVTPGRLVFAAVSERMMSDAATAARHEAKSQGKGVLGRFTAQFAWMEQICRQYAALPVDAILAQFPGSFFIPNTQIKRIRLRHADASEGAQNGQQLLIDSAAGKLRFTSSMMRVREARQILRRTMGRIVK